jgi:hypothetical protein
MPCTARRLSSRDGESWSILREWDARHIHDVRVNPHNDWIYVGRRRIRTIVQGPSAVLLPVNFYRELVILGTDHPEGGNGVYVLEDDGSDRPVSPRLKLVFPNPTKG